MTGRKSMPSRGRVFWLVQVFGKPGGKLDRLDYFKGVLLLFLILLPIGLLLFDPQRMMHTLNPGTPEEAAKLVLPVLVVPVRLIWAYLDSKRLRSLGLPALLGPLAHSLSVVSQFIPDFVVPPLAGMIFYIYFACLLLLPSASRIIAHSRTGRKLTILGMEEKE